MISFGISLLIALGCYLIVQYVSSPSLVRLAKLFGGDLASGGYIQILTFIAFFIGWLELRDFSTYIRQQQSGFQFNVLPEKEHYVLYADDVRKIQRDLQSSPKRGLFILIEIVIQLATKFLRTANPGEVIDMNSNLIRLKRDESEKDQSLIRYILWLIPSLGFIGTVLGISAAMGEISGADINKITVDLGIAFDTTLVALVLSSTLLGYFHKIQHQTDAYFIDLEKYLLNHFINRLEV